MDFVQHKKGAVITNKQDFMRPLLNLESAHPGG